MKIPHRGRRQASSDASVGAISLLTGISKYWLVNIFPGGRGSDSWSLSSVEFTFISAACRSGRWVLGWIMLSIATSIALRYTILFLFALNCMVCIFSRELKSSEHIALMYINYFFINLCPTPFFIYKIYRMDIIERELLKSLKNMPFILKRVLSKLVLT